MKNMNKIMGIIKAIFIILEVLILWFSDNPDARIFAGIGIVCLVISSLLGGDVND